MECRLCLRFSPVETVVSIYGNHDCDSLAQHIFSCCQLQVQKDDSLPVSICSSCDFNLHFFVKFKDVCIRSDKILRLRLAKVLNIKTEEVLLEDLNWEEEFVENSLSHSRFSVVANKENEINSKKDVKKEIDLVSTLKEEAPMVEISSWNGDITVENSLYDEENDFLCCKSKTQTLQIDISSQKNSEEINSINSKFECKHCEKLFFDKSKLRSHILIHLKQKPSKGKSKVKNNCKNCMKNFAHESSLKRHLENNCPEKKFQCGICFKSFKCLSYLKFHEKIHTGKTDYKCNICSKYFITPGSLQRHLKLHYNLKPHKCNLCFKSFARKYNLKMHQKVHTRKEDLHVSKSELRDDRIHKCNVCFKSFFTKTNLTSHMNLHSSGKLHICEICPAKFNRKGNLERHMVIHTENKPYMCDICSKTFARKSNLSVHVKLHTGNKPFT